jgi:hypothetical protein
MGDAERTDVLGEGVDGKKLRPSPQTGPSFLQLPYSSADAGERSLLQVARPVALAHEVGQSAGRKRWAKKKGLRPSLWNWSEPNCQGCTASIGGRWGRICLPDCTSRIRHGTLRPPQLRILSGPQVHVKPPRPPLISEGTGQHALWGIGEDVEHVRFALGAEPNGTSKKIRPSPQGTGRKNATLSTAIVNRRSGDRYRTTFVAGWTGIANR